MQLIPVPDPETLLVRGQIQVRSASLRVHVTRFLLWGAIAVVGSIAILSLLQALFPAPPLHGCGWGVACYYHSP